MDNGNTFLPEQLCKVYELHIKGLVYSRTSIDIISFPQSPLRGSSIILETSLVAQTVRHLPTMQETRVQSLGWEDPLEKEMAIHSIDGLPGWH